MGIFDYLGYVLSGSDNAKVKSGKCKSVAQIRKEAVEFSNNCWNHTLRKELQKPVYQSLYDNQYKRKYDYIRGLIEQAKHRAEFNYGHFVMDSDVMEMYLELQRKVKEEQSKNKPSDV